MPKARRNRLLENWAIWGGLSLAGALVLGGGSVYTLITQPPKPDCSFVVWPIAPASVRLYCAQELTTNPTLENLIEAIALVDALDEDHPLRGAIDPRIEVWSEMLLDQAEDTFHQGDIDTAIAYAKQIPLKTKAAKLVEERTSRWRRIWSEGQAIEARVAFALREEDWRKAFGLMVDFLYVDSRYFSQTQYQYITDVIIQAQKDEKKVVEAEQLFKQGGFDNLEKSLSIARELSSDTIFALSQKKIYNGVAEDLLKIAESALAEENLTEAIDALALIPRESQLWEYSQDLSKIANATSLTWVVSTDGYTSAIQQLSEVPKDSRVYGKAQSLIQRWKGEIKTVKVLEDAQLKALSGDLSDLQAAIAMAQTVPRTSDKWQLAQEDIRDWANQIERTEDQPILDLADELAVPGDERSLQAAIAQAQRIGPSRVMFDDAQSRISYWRARLDDLVSYRLPVSEPTYQEDSNLFPELEPPRELSQPIPESAPISDLELEQTTSVLSEAWEMAEQGTPDALRAAMDLANQIPDSSIERSEAEFEISNWGNQLLLQAESQATIDPQAAIAIASKIPSYSNYFSQAQVLISDLSNAQSLQVTPENPPAAGALE